MSLDAVREYHRWVSPSLGRAMEVLTFGRGGTRLIAFPPMGGRFYDWENAGLVAALAPEIERGVLSVVCVDTVDAESWGAAERLPLDRVKRHAAYDKFLRSEVLPFATWRHPDPAAPVHLVGVDFGAYHAVSFAIKHPHLVAGAVGLSGTYGSMARYTDGVAIKVVRDQSPEHLLTGETVASRLAALRRLELWLACGTEDGEATDTTRALQQAAQQARVPLSVTWHEGQWHDWGAWARVLRAWADHRWALARTATAVASPTGQTVDAAMTDTAVAVPMLQATGS